VDDLDRSIARRTAKNPGYHEMLQAEVRRQRLIAASSPSGKVNHLTQAQVAAEMTLASRFVGRDRVVQGPTFATRRSTAMADAVIWGRAVPGRPLPYLDLGQSPLRRWADNRRVKAFCVPLRRTIGDGIRPGAPS